MTSAVVGIEILKGGMDFFGINVCVKDNFGIMFTLIIIEFYDLNRRDLSSHVW